MIENISLNNNWYYSKNYIVGMEHNNLLNNYELINLPHTNTELPFNYFDETSFQFVSCYKYPLRLSPKLKDKILLVHFEGVMAYSKVYINKVLLGEHSGGYTPFKVRIDEYYDWDSNDNQLTVVVDSNELPNIPPFGGQIDYLTYGGIYREVFLEVFEKTYISNIKIETNKVLESTKAVSVTIFAENLTTEQCSSNITITLCDGNNIVLCTQNATQMLSVSETIFNIELDNLSDIELWDIDNPVLYSINVELSTSFGTDNYQQKFGFRTAEFRPDGFFLNGKPLKIRGLNRHQAFPYVGYAMPKRVQQKDADILKFELNLNTVRTSHYPQSRHFLDRCDEIGLLVFEEIPGWQHIGNEEWKELSLYHVKEMIIRDWNHPSIIIWGVRINESLDDDPFYTATNKIAHSLDTTRQTGGVRYIKNSNLLEDVYTFNDFNEEYVISPLREQQEITGLDHKVPYLVTEFNGHMYPTKRFDQEERQMEHALRHMRIQNAYYRDNSISGGIGWCAFDYNTHRDFGSGDKICYHGVMDMFRLPKFAAYSYSSQCSPDIKPVLEPVTYWARGERSIGGIIPLVIMTNCDYVDVKFGQNEPIRGLKPNRKQFEAVPYAPIIVDFSTITPEQVGAWGMTWHDVTFYGYYKNQVVVTKKFTNNPVPTELVLTTDCTNLDSSQKDATRVVVKVTDQVGNLMPFFNEVFSIEVSGCGRLIGPNSLAAMGGSFAFWVETNNEVGTINISVKCSIGKKDIAISVE